MSDLEQALRELPIDWPPTPDVAAAVRARIAAEGAAPAGAPPEPGRRPRWRSRLAWAPAHPALAAVLAALLALAGAMAVEPARSAILEVLGLKGAQIERKAPAATPSPVPPGAPLGEGLGLGEPATVAEARRRAGFDVAEPGAGLGPPDAVFFAPGPPRGGRVSFLYRARAGLPRAAETGAGLLITQLEATVEPVIQKAAGPGTRIERFQIAGANAILLSGDPHGFAYTSPDTGEVAFEEQRLAGETLLVEAPNGMLIRIEGRVSRERATEIARSILRG